MCGIAGILAASAADREALEYQVRLMSGTMIHRGPDGSGVWVDAGGQVALGQRRLAIIDLSPSGAQPMLSADGNVALTYNGEIYNHLDLRAELEAQGARFRGTSDSETLVEACARWGVERTLKKLNGIFAFAVWDAREGVLWLARDRAGVKPLYWTQTAAGLLFGSELKAIAAHESFRGELDIDALGAYFQFNYVPAPATIYRGVRKLMPGSVLRISRSGEPREQLYWDVYAVAEQGLESRRPAHDVETIENLDWLLRDSVKRQMISDVPLGALLSGGIDSSTVTALMQSQSAEQVKTFSIGFEEADHNEAPFAAAVAKHLGTDHHELYVAPDDALRTIPSLTDWYDEPFADSSQIPTYLVSRLAREHVTVALSGDGGDELFAGYPRYTRHARARRVAMAVPFLARAPLAAAIRSIGGPAWQRAFKLLPQRYQTKAGAASLLRFATAMEQMDPREFHRLLVTYWGDPSDMVPDAHYCATQFARTLPSQPMHHIEVSQLIDVVTYLVDDILCKVDRASMAVSLETRVPILDHRIIEFTWRLPIEMKERDGRMKWLLRQVLYRYVPSELIERPKKGFSIPMATWLRTELRDWAEDLLDERKLRQDGILNTHLVRTIWREHLSGEMNHSDRIWAVLQYLDWSRKWLGVGSLLQMRATPERSSTTARLVHS